MIRPTTWSDYPLIAEMFLDWPADDEGPCTTERTRLNMAKWFAKFNPFVFELDFNTEVPPQPAKGIKVVGVINANEDFSEVIHAVIHPDERGNGYFDRMQDEFAAVMIAQGVEEMGFGDITPAKFIAERFHPESTIQGQTGEIRRSRVFKADFD